MNANDLIKKQQRIKVKQQIDSLTSEQKFIKSHEIYLKILNYGFIDSNKLIFCYLSTVDEVSTKEIIRYAIDKNIRLAVPCIYENKMYALRYFGEELSQNKYGIYEPKFDDSKITIVKDGIVFVPLLAYDIDLNRLGHGKGYYDRFFAENPNCLKVALAFEEQKLNKVSYDSFDVTMDYIITDKKIYRAGDKI